MEIGDGRFLHFRHDRLAKMHAGHFFRRIAQHAGEGCIHILENFILNDIHAGQGLLDDAAKGNIDIRIHANSKKKGPEGPCKE